MRRALAALVLLATSRIASAAELEVGYRHESLTHGPAWRELSVAAAWGELGRPRLDLEIRELERFATRDSEFRAAVSAPIGSRWGVAGEISTSAGGGLVPVFAAGASLQRRLGRGYLAAAGVRWSAYDSATAGIAHVGLGTLALERYWGRFRVGWIGYLATLDAQWSASNAAAWDLYYGEAERVGVRVAAGREIESTGVGDPGLSTVFAAGVSGRHGLGGRWAVIYDAGIHRQGDLYTRTGARIGLRRDF